MAAYITKQQLADRITAAKLALDSLNAKNASLKLTKHSTMMRIPLIQEFQTIEGTLKADGLYGVNTKAAITWYLQTYPKPQTIPNVNSSWAGQPLTWTAPALEPATKVTEVKEAPKEAPKEVAKAPTIKTSTKKKKKKKFASPFSTKMVVSQIAKSVESLSNTKVSSSKVSDKDVDSKDLTKTKTKAKTKKKTKTKTKTKKQTKKKKDTKKVISEETSKPGFLSTTGGKVALGSLAAVGLLAALA